MNRYYKVKVLELCDRASVELASQKSMLIYARKQARQEIIEKHSHKKFIFWGPKELPPTEEFIDNYIFNHYGDISTGLFRINNKVKSINLIMKAIYMTDDCEFVYLNISDFECLIDHM